MKNGVLKVCAVGLVTTLILTGCGSREGKVSKIKKNEEISYSKQSILDDYYGLELYQYSNNTQLEADYESAKEDYLQREEVVEVNVLTKEDDMYEAILTLDESTSFEERKVYEYILYMKNDKDYIILFQTSNNKNKENIKKIGEEVKSKFNNSTNYSKEYNEFVKSKNLETGIAYGCNGIVSCKNSMSATNVKAKEYVETDKKVSTVDMYFHEISPNTFKVLVEATTDEGEIIWSLDLGEAPHGIGLNMVSYQNGNHYYLSDFMSDLYKIDIYDVQTGKVITTLKDIEDAETHVLEEVNDKVFDMQQLYTDNLQVFDAKTGKSLYYIKDIQKVIPNNRVDYYIDRAEGVKVENDEIIYPVIDGLNGHVKVGSIKVNVNTYKVTYVEE